MLNINDKIFFKAYDGNIVISNHMVGIIKKIFYVDSKPSWVRVWTWCHGTRSVAISDIVSS